MPEEYVFSITPKCKFIFELILELNETHIILTGIKY